jgi:hypothetical protein
MSKLFHGFVSTAAPFIRRPLLFSLLLAAACAFVACNEDEGLGGSLAVEGYVYNVIHYDDNLSFTKDTVPALGKKVYISFGANTSEVGDNVDTGFDGYYRFNYLRKGQYRIYAYSETGNGVKSPVSQIVTVDGKTNEAPAIYIHTGKANGASFVRGRVIATYSRKGVPYAGTDSVPTGIRAYIRNVDEKYYFDDVRVTDGVFYFQKIFPGKYVVGVESQQSANEKVELIQSDTINVVEPEKIYDLPGFIKVNKAV